MLQKLGLQLYTIRHYMNNEAELDESFAKLAAMGYTEAHTAGNAVDPELFAGLLKKHGISIIGIHCPAARVLGDPYEAIRYYQPFETRNIGVGMMKDGAKKSYDEVMRFIEDFNRAAEIYAKEGYRLTYHNHTFEFFRIKGNTTIMDLLVQNLDPQRTSFVLDTCWVANAGADVRYWMEKLAGRVDILHIKDLMVVRKEDFREKQVVTEIGNGNLWWQGILETAARTGVKHYIVEQDENWINNDPFASLKVSADYLKQFIK